MMKQNENEMNSNVPLEIIKASEIEPKEVKWLWYPYIPFGKVSLSQENQSNMISTEKRKNEQDRLTRFCSFVPILLFTLYR